MLALPERRCRLLPHAPENFTVSPRNCASKERAVFGTLTATEAKVRAPMDPVHVPEKAKSGTTLAPVHPTAAETREHERDPGLRLTLKAIHVEAFTEGHRRPADVHQHAPRDVEELAADLGAHQVDPAAAVEGAGEGDGRGDDAEGEPRLLQRGSGRC